MKIMPIIIAIIFVSLESCSDFTWMVENENHNENN